MHSMTGFGLASEGWPEVEISIEVRTVNSRYLDLRSRLPKEAQNLEAGIRDRVQSAMARGRVEVTLALEMRSNQLWQLNETLLRGYQQAAAQAADLGVPGELRIEQILQLPGILQAAELDLSQEELQERVLEVLDVALKKLIESRQREGEALGRDILERLLLMTELVDAISAQAGDLSERYREKLEKRIATLRIDGSFDEGRLAQEICYYAERADISEEVTRLTAHIARFRELLETREEAQMGRNLDFLCQEMNREINTIASKASKAQIAEFAVEGKVVIEKIREQVQNVE